MTVTVNPLVTPTFTQVAAICAGGSFTLPTTSTNAISGTWSPAINNAATTTYTFTPASGVCATTATMTVTVNPVVTPTFTQVAPICAGGSFTLPTTSNNAVTGTWSPAINNATTTTYTFTATGGTCVNTATMTVTVNPVVTPTFTQVAPICAGGTFSLPTTSNNAVTGTWSPAINNAATTTYTFTPTAGSCANTATMTVTVNPVVTPTFTQVAAICAGTSFTLPTASTNTVPVTGTWSPAINTAATTTYTFTPAAGTCANTATMTVTVKQPSTSSTTVTSSSAYDWNGNTYYNSGVYTWTGTNAAGCDSVATLNLTVTSVSFVYPNPNRGVFYISYSDREKGLTSKCFVTVYDAKGARVYTKTIATVANSLYDQIDLSLQPKGIYNIELVDASGVRLKTSKVVFN
jgi:hypothetical protein